jgi:hypothetical protein
VTYLLANINQQRQWLPRNWRVCWRWVCLIVVILAGACQQLTHFYVTQQSVAVSTNGLDARSA